MSFRVLLRPEAEADIGDAATWYEEQRAGLGREFVEAIFHAVDALSGNPLLTSRRHRRRNIRWVIPDRFPYPNHLRGGGGYGIDYFCSPRGQA